MRPKLIKIDYAWDDFDQLIDEMINDTDAQGTIIELGAGANPCLTKEQVGRRRYVLIDTSSEELEKAKGDYFERSFMDITSGSVEIKADLVISQMLMEHVSNPEAFHRAVWHLLKPRGKVIHFYATLYSPASLVNLILPEKWSKGLLYKLQKREWVSEGKFPAFYRWSYGPTKRQIKRLESVGFGIVRFTGYLGQYYFWNMNVLKHLEKLWNKILWKVNSPLLCSNAIVVLNKE